jgi:hypothetical protein
LQGAVHGGQQPVSGRHGYGLCRRYDRLRISGAGSGSTTPRPAQLVCSRSPPPQTCTTNDQVYLVATGGNPGVAGTQNNSALALMAAVGLCGNFSSTTSVAINELTTVGAVWPLAPFMTSATHVGTSATNAIGLTNAFNTIYLKMVYQSTGQAPSPFLNANAVFPLTEVNTLADILAACVNTVDTAGPTQSSICQSDLCGGCSGWRGANEYDSTGAEPREESDIGTLAVLAG